MVKLITAPKEKKKLILDLDGVAWTIRPSKRSAATHQMFNQSRKYFALCFAKCKKSAKHVLCDNKKIKGIILSYLA